MYNTSRFAADDARSVLVRAVNEALKNARNGNSRLTPETESDAIIMMPRGTVETKRAKRGTELLDYHIFRLYGGVLKEKLYSKTVSLLRNSSTVIVGMGAESRVD